MINDEKSDEIIIGKRQIKNIKAIRIAAAIISFIGLFAVLGFTSGMLFVLKQDIKQETLERKV